MKQILFLVMLQMWFAMYSCKQPDQRVQNSAAAQKNAVQHDTIKKINIYISQLASPDDPVCGMPLSEKTIEDTAMINGKIYGYCNTGCKEEHMKQVLAIKKPIPKK